MTGSFKSIGVNVGLWNSLHTGAAGLDGPSGELWYESDFYATFGLGFGEGTSLGVTYTAYTSPNGVFNTVRELSFKFALETAVRWGARRPNRTCWSLVSWTGRPTEVLEEGTYLELGAAPGLPVGRVDGERSAEGGVQPG